MSQQVAETGTTHARPPGVSGDARGAYFALDEHIDHLIDAPPRLGQRGDGDHPGVASRRALHGMSLIRKSPARATTIALVLALLAIFPLQFDRNLTETEVPLPMPLAARDGGATARGGGLATRPC
jgi:hypothetical protein